MDPGLRRDDTAFLVASGVPHEGGEVTRATKPPPKKQKKPDKCLSTGPASHQETGPAAKPAREMARALQRDIRTNKVAPAAWVAGAIQ